MPEGSQRSIRLPTDPPAPAPHRPLQLLALAALLVAALALAPSARCQGDTEFGIWGGYSVGTPHLIGVTSNRQLGVLALRYGHSIYDWSNISLQYTLDIIPIEFINQPKYVACTTIQLISPQVSAKSVAKTSTAAASIPSASN